jgi:hypothetical protein|tara:strand:- start:376 stop:549 length:174 start_codon:yes stop_codon:yes gene_type:complete
MELLKEYGQEPTVAKVKTAQGLFEVLYGDMIIASCASKEEAEVLAENYNLSKNVGQS